MKRHYAFLSSLLTLGTVTFSLRLEAQAPQPRLAAEQILADAADKQQYTFLIFYKDEGRSTQAMAETMKRGIAAHNGGAAIAYVNVANQSDRALVDRLDVSRAPMPLAMAIAPNGAITGVFPRKVSAEQIVHSFVTPAMASCMKTMQGGKLALLCVLPSSRSRAPAGVQAFCADPQFKDRVVVLTVQSDDPEEVEFLQELAGEGHAANESMIALFAPPGALVGTFSSAASVDELAAALHKAGKCCEDPNCKYNQGNRQAAQGAKTRK